MQQSAHHIIIQKLDAFIRAYYKNQITRGFFLTLLLLLILFLLVVFAEYLGHFNSLVRAALFYGLILGLVLSVSWLIFWPLSKLFRLGKTLTYSEASVIIGNHFPQVKDKLLNVLELQQVQNASTELAQAAIELRTKQLKPIAFHHAIDVHQTKKTATYLLVPILILLITSFVAPYILSKGSLRLMQYQKVFPKEFPYAFVIQNDHLRCYQGDDFKLIFQVQGSKRPADIFIKYEGHEYKLQPDVNDYASYTFENIKKELVFSLTDGQDVVLQDTIEVIPQSKIKSYQLYLDYPAYTKRVDEVLKNRADLSIPQGTKVQWVFQADHTKKIELSLLAENKKWNLNYLNNTFTATATPKQSGLYSVVLHHATQRMYDTLLHNVQVIEDQHPQLLVEEFKDSLQNHIFYYKGQIADDYGFTALQCHISWLDDQGVVKQKQMHNIPITSGFLQQNFYHLIDTKEWLKQPGTSVEYYFQLSDNDAVHGPKSVQSKVFNFAVPSLKELTESKDALASEIKKDISQSIQEAKKLQKELEQMYQEVSGQKNLSWEQKNKMNQLLQKQKELQKQLEQDQKQQRELLEQTQMQEEQNEILQKQQKLQEMMEELLSEDMKKMIQELEKLLEETQPKDRAEKIEELKLNNKDIQKELDRSLELFKQLEFEQKLKDNIQKLDELAKDQKELQKEVEKSKEASALESAEKKQEELQKKYQDLQQEMQKMQEMNQALEFQNELPNTDQKQQEISQDMKSAQESLDKKNKKSASDKQKNAADKMEELKQSLSQAEQQMEQDAQEENLEDMRQLMENLVKLSFEQEDLLKNMRKTSPQDPKYTEQIQTQKKLKDFAKMIEDSLFALSKRVPDMESIVNKELHQINDNLAKTLESLTHRKTFEANAKQQLVMTSLNNLALLFDEMIQQAQQQMAQQKQGQSSCNKPGANGKPKPGDMRKAQQKLSEQLEKLKNELQKQKDGQGKPGGSAMSKELAKMAAQQEAIRRQLQEMMEDMQSNGEKAGGNLKKIGDLMEETERDIVNKRITQQTIERQQDILTRLLESEKADREREQDPQRESNEARQQEKRNLLEEFKYKDKKRNNVDPLEVIPPNMVDFYKQKVNEYFNNSK